MKTPLNVLRGWFATANGGHTSDERKARFEQLMVWAKRLEADANLDGLEDLIKLMLRPVQALHMREVLLRTEPAVPEGLWWTLSMGELWDGRSPEGDSWLDFMWKHGRRPARLRHVVRLASDMVLPTLWSRSSIQSTLGTLGPGRRLGSFVQDIRDHRITLMLPMRIAWVGEDSHAIAQGILSGEGELIPDEVFDVSAVIKAVRFDGEGWVCLKSGARLGAPVYPEFGWVWEISRLIIGLQEWFIQR